MSDKLQTARKFLRYIKGFFQKAMAPALDPRPGHPLIDPHAVSPYPRQRHDTFVTGFDGPHHKRRTSDANRCVHACLCPLWQLCVGHFRVRRVSSFNRSVNPRTVATQFV